MAQPFSFESLGVAEATPGSGFSFDRAVVDQQRVKSINEAIWHGVQSSATGLAARGKLPEQQLDKDAPWYHRLAANAAGMAADLPLSIAGALPAAPGGPIAMGAAGFAAPMALRDALMEAYTTEHAVSWSDAWSIAKAGVTGAVKGAVIGGATMGAGKVVAPLVRGGAVAKGLAATGAELATMTTTAAALEGHLPSAQDFMDNAILLGGLKGAVHVAGKLRNIYAETGKTPGEVLADAVIHPALKAELLGQSVTASEAARAAFPERLEPVVRAATLKDGSAATVEFLRDDPFVKFSVISESGERLGGGAFRPREDKGAGFQGDYFVNEQFRRNGVMTAAVDAFEAATGQRVSKGSTTSESAAAFWNSRSALKAELKGELPPVPEGYVRLYRGQPEGTFPPAVDWIQGQGASEAGRWFTTDSAGTSFFGPKQVYVDVPKSVAAEAFGGSRTHPETGHLLPAEWANRARRVDELPAMYQPLALEQRIKAAVENDPRPELIRQTLEANRAPDKIGDVAADHIRYEYIADKDSAAGVLRATTELYQAEIAKQTRGEVPNTQTATEALRLIAGGEIGEHIVGKAGNAAEIYARAHILRGAANHAVAEMAKIADIPPAELSPAMKLQALAAIERVSMLKAEIEGIGAEAGRSLQILGAIKRDPSFLGEAETLLKLAERKGALQDIAALARDFKDPAQMAQFARDYAKATTTEKVLEAWKAAILSGPQTHLANVMGNSAKWLLDIPERTIAATLYAAERAIRGDPLSMAQYKARALSPLFGLQMGAMDSLKVAAAVWKQKGEMLEKADVYRTAIEGKTGDVVRIPFRLLQVEDALFRTTAERAEAYIMAVDRAAKEGVLHPGTKEYNAQIVEWVQHPERGLSEKAGLAAIERVQQAGAEAVFSERLGPRMETVQRAMAGHPIGFIAPFVRTPVNLLSWAVQHTPGFMLSGRWRADFAAGGERQAKAVSRVIVGTGLAMTAYSLAQEGLITGGGLFDREMGRTKGGAGHQPYSFLINGQYYSYQRMEPVAKVLGIAADLVELSQSKKLSEEDQAKALGMLVLMFGNATVSTTYLSGLSNAMQSILDPERYGENFLEQYASSLVPKIVGQTVMLADPYKREVDGVMDAIQSQLPYFREQLLPKRDAWGEPQKNDRWFYVMPVARTTKSDDLVRTEAVRLQVAISDAPRYTMESGPFNAREKRIKLEPEQRDIIREVSGTKAMEILSPIVNAPDWRQIPDFAKAAIYKDVLKGTREQGVYAALPPDAAERVKLREKIVQKIIQQTQEVGGN